MGSLDDLAADRNAAWAGAGLSRTLREFTGPQEPVTRIDGRRLLLFASSNYLGLATHPGVTGAARAALEVYGAGSGGSRLTTGTTDLHTGLERRLAEVFGGDGHEDAVFFATGYQANLAVLQTIAGPDVTVYSDSLNHPSIIDGCRLARAVVRVFPHDDLAALDRLLGECATPHALVVSDGVFSMDGDLADLPGLVAVAERHGAWTMIDDAHGVGTLGPTGRGSVEHHGVRPDLLVGTASKALGGRGRFRGVLVDGRHAAAQSGTRVRLLHGTFCTDRRGCVGRGRCPRRGTGVGGHAPRQRPRVRDVAGCSGAGESDHPGSGR